MRIEAGKHPAATKITDVLINGVPIQRGTCRWVDLDRGEVCFYRTGADGKHLVEGGRLVEHIVSGVVMSVRIPDEFKGLLTWGSGS